MTACLYMRPKSRPLLLSDTVVTRTSDDLDALVLPGALVRYSGGVEFKRTAIARKVYLFGNDVAAACAGDVRAIEDFLADVDDATSTTIGPDRMALIFDQLARYEGRVEAIVCYEDGRQNGFICSLGSQREVQGLTTLIGVGSGGNDLANIVDFDFQRFDRARIEEIESYDLISNIAGRAASRMLGNEVLFGFGKDWGGFAEWATWDRAERRWRYGLPCLHLFVLAVPLPDGRFTLEVSRDWYCYESDERSGTSSVLGVRLMDTLVAQQWTFEDIRSPDPVAERTFESWIGWQPDQVVVQIFPYGRVELGPLFVSCGRFSDLTFDIAEGGVAAGVTTGVLDGWGQAASSWWRLEFMSASTLDDGQLQKAFHDALNGGWTQRA